MSAFFSHIIWKLLFYTRKFFFWEWNLYIRNTRQRSLQRNWNMIYAFLQLITKTILSKILQLMNWVLVYSLRILTHFSLHIRVKLCYLKEFISIFNAYLGARAYTFSVFRFICIHTCLWYYLRLSSHVFVCKCKKNVRFNVQ